MLITRAFAIPVLAATFALAACASDATDPVAAPAAPTMLSAAALGGGAHLTWTDNSDNETEFMIMRMEVGTDADYKTLASVPFNSTQYHDAPLTPGKSYMYMVMAMNDGGETNSNEITFAAP